MKKITGYFGMLGIVFFLFGIISFILDILQGKVAKLSLYPTINTALGILLIIIYLVFNTQSLREIFTRRSTKYGANKIIYAILFLGVLVFLNVIFITQPKFSYQVDLTKNKVFSLSDQSIKVLKNLKTKVEVIGFFNVGAPERNFVSDILERFNHYSKNIDYKLVDADSDPTLAKEYEVTNGSVIVQSEKNKTKVNEFTEADFTNAIIQVTKKHEKYIYFVKGHGEAGLDDENENGLSFIKKYIGNEGYNIKEISLNQSDQIPNDCAVLIIMGPKNKFESDEVLKIEQYLNKGGSAFFGLEPNIERAQGKLTQVGLDELLSKFGLSLDDDIILFEPQLPEFLQKLVGRQVKPQVVVDSYESHPITNEFNKKTVFRFARSIKKTSKEDSNIRVRELIKTGAEGFWGETDIMGLISNKTEKNKSDLPGPLTIAYAIERDTKPDEKDKLNNESRIVVFGNASFISNTLITGTSNADLFLNTLNWQTGEVERISIRPKQIQASSITWTREEASTIFYVSVLVIPQLILVFGLLIWRYRKGK
jgi:ABC-type uncharacterized transport system involved in gliding motility auxiliary subunit